MRAPDVLDPDCGVVETDNKIGLTGGNDAFFDNRFHGVNRSLKPMWQKSCINGAPSKEAAAMLAVIPGINLTSTSFLLADQFEHQPGHTVNPRVTAADQRHVVPRLRQPIAA